MGMGMSVSLPLDSHVLALLGYSSMPNPADLEMLLRKMGLDLLAAAGDITDITGPLQNSAQLQPYPNPNLSCVTCAILLSRFNGLVNGDEYAGTITPAQVDAYVRLLLTIASKMDAILQVIGSKYDIGAVTADLRNNLFGPKNEEDDGPEPMEYRHPEWEGEPESPLVRTSTPLPPPQYMVHTMAEYGTIIMPSLPSPTGPLRSLFLDQMGRKAICQASIQLLGLPEMMDYKDVGIFVLLLWDFLLYHGLHGPLDMREFMLHPDFVPLESLLNLAPVDKGALLLLQCLFAQVLSALGYEPNPEEEGDVESLAPLRSLLENPEDITICIQQLLRVLQRSVQGSA